MKRWIYLFVFLFWVSFVYADTNGCCQLTFAGDSCRYTSESSCAEGFISGALCEHTDACSVGCCVSSEGCFEGDPKYTCSLNSGDFFDGQVCSSLENCQMTCCKFGSDYSFMNNNECQSLIDEYGSDIIQSFSVSDEAACEELEDQEDKGCCVTSEGCSYATQAECGSSSYDSNGFGFFENEYCDGVASYLEEMDYASKDYCVCESSENVCDECVELINLDDLLEDLQSDLPHSIERYAHSTLSGATVEGVVGLVDYAGRLRPNVERDARYVRTTISTSGAHDLESFREIAVLERASQRTLQDMLPHDVEVIED